MKGIKRVLSAILVCVMTIALVPVVSTPITAEAAATGTTALFNGNATYLLQERFAEPKTVDPNNTGNKVASGWDIDYRGGSFTAWGGVATITDTSVHEKVSLNRKLMKHEGDGLVLESSFKYTPYGKDEPIDSGFYYEVSGDDKVALKLSVERKADGSCYFSANGQDTGVACVMSATYCIKAEFMGSNVMVWINDEDPVSVSYLEATNVIDEIEIGTTEAQASKVELYYVYMYANYTVNDSFLGSYATDWDVANGSVVVASGSPYKVDLNGFALNPVPDIEFVPESTIVDVGSDFETGVGGLKVCSTGTITATKGTAPGGRNALVINSTAKAEGYKDVVGFAVTNASGVQYQQGNLPTTGTVTMSVDIMVEDTTVAVGGGGSFHPQVFLRTDGTGFTNPSGPQEKALLTDMSGLRNGEWKTFTKTIDASELNWSATGSNYVFFIVRPNMDKAGTMYIDNMSLTIVQDAKYLEKTVDISGTNSVIRGSSVTSITSATDPADSSNSVIKATGLSSGYSSVIGVPLVDTAGNAVKELVAGDIIEYSIRIRPTQDIVISGIGDSQPGILFRRGNWTDGGTGPSSGSHYQMEAPKTIPANTWTTLTGSHTVQSSYTNINLTGSDNINVFIRTNWSSAGDIYIDDFSVAVKKEVAAAESSSLSKSFEKLTGKHSFSFNVLVPTTGADGFSATFGGVEFKAKNGKFYLGDKELYTYTNNVWYNVEIQTDGTTADAYINSVQYASGESAKGTLNSITFKNSASTQVVIDDVQVCKAFAKSDYSDYPSTPDIKTSSYNLGMVSYPMWREGIQYGWDFISSFSEEREPYLGYYTGGSREVADWHNKWMLEHGIDHVIYPMPRPDITGTGAVKIPVRGEELHDGFLKSEYRKKTADGTGLQFAVMITQPTNARYDSAEEFIANVQPFMIEHYFKNPAYKKIDNKIVIYSYAFGDLITYLGGADQVDTVLGSLNQAVIDNNLGSGIVLIANYEDAVTSFRSGSYTNKDKVYIWRYGWRSDNPTSIASGIKTLYSDTGSRSVASIPMGFDNTAWQTNWVDMMTPAEVKTICDSVKGTTALNLYLFTCWDEYGEGHFYAPSTKAGFGYLDAIRDSFIGETTHTDSTPTTSAKKRMGVLYPEGRQMLKVRDRIIYDPTLFSDSNKLATVSLKDGTRSGWFLDYSYSNEGELNGCTSSRTGSGSGPYNFTYTSSGGYAQQVTWNLSDVYSGSAIDITKVTAIKINGYSQNSSEMVLKLGTSSNQNYPAEYRFSGPGPNSTTAQDIILLPDDRTKLLTTAASDSTLTSVQFNLSTYTASGSKFDVDSITFYTGDLPREVDVIVDGTKYELVSKARFEENTTYLPAYKFLVDMGAYPVWDKETQTLTVTKDGITAKFTAGSKAVEVSEGGVATTLSANAYYDAGNLYVPYDGLLAPFGYTVTNSNNVITYANKFAGQSYDETDYKWDFEIDGNLDGWASSSTLKYPADVKDGMLHVRSKGTDSVITKSGLNIPKADAKYAVIKFKKTDVASAMQLKLYHGASLPTASGLAYRFNFEPSNEIQTYVIDLVNTAPYIGKYEDLVDKIDNIRIDPMDGTNLYGSIYIDSIEFTKEDPTYVEPEAPKMVAYGFEEENMFDLTIDKIGTGYSNLLNANGTTAGDVLPPVETVDGYENVMKLVPAAGANNGLFNLTAVYYNGSRQTIQKVAEGDEIVKVSFWYKAYGNGTGFTFENRQGGLKDGENIKKLDASTTEWKYFEDYLDMSKVADTSRWFSLRIHRNGTTVANGGLYVRDYKLVCLDKDTPLTSYSYDETIAVVVTGYDGIEDTIGTMFISEHDLDGDVLNKISSGVYPMVRSVTRDTKDGSGATVTSTNDETLKYFFYRPRATVSDEIRAFLWDDFVPVIDPFTIKKN